MGASISRRRRVEGIAAAAPERAPINGYIPPEPFVEADEAAEFLHSSPRTVMQMAREGKIPAHPFGDGPRKRWFFLISELADFLRARVNSPHGDQAGRDATRRIM